MIYVLAILVLLITLSPAAMALPGYNVSVNVNEYIRNLTYNNGTPYFDGGYGFITVTNPSSSFDLINVRINPSADGSSGGVFHCDLQARYNVTKDYPLNRSAIRIPLSLRESVSPDYLSPGQAGDQITLVVELENTGDRSLTGLRYERPLPPVYSGYNLSPDTGSATISSGYLNWSAGTLSPGSRVRLTITLNVTPSGDIVLPPANVWYTYPSSVITNNLNFIAYSDTSITVKKTYMEDDDWQATIDIVDETDFNYLISNVTLYRSTLDDPYSMTWLRTYDGPIYLEPGDRWGTTYEDNYTGVPVYFARMVISALPDVTGTSMPMAPAVTQQFIVRTSPVASPSPSPVVSPSPSPQASPTTNPTASPSPSAQPSVSPSPSVAVSITPTASPSNTILPSPVVSPSPTPVPVRDQVSFTNPGRSNVIRSNSTVLEVSVTAGSDPGFVAFYQSLDNGTWSFIDRQDVVNDMSRQQWLAENGDGRYYFKAEYYNTNGLAGTAYASIVVDTAERSAFTTLLTGLNDTWPLLLLILLLSVPVLFVRNSKRRAVYDSSAIGKLIPMDRRELSQFPKPLMPEVKYDWPEKFKSESKIRFKGIKNPETLLSLKERYGLSDFDAYALQFAIENKLRIYTHSEEMFKIYQAAGAKVRMLKVRR